METRHLEKMLFNLMNAQMGEYPFPHFVVKDVFPEDTFFDIIKNMPRQEDYTGINETGLVKGYANKEETRFMFQFGKDMDKLDPERRAFWDKINNFMCGPHFLNCILTKFAPFIAERFTAAGKEQKITMRLDLLRDFTGYELGPHTDTRRRLLNVFFYLPRDNDHAHMGTSFYVSKDPAFISDGSSHLNFDDFINVYTVPALQNVAAAFFRNDKSFHGVEPVAEKGYERNALAISMYAD